MNDAGDWENLDAGRLDGFDDAEACCECGEVLRTGPNVEFTDLDDGETKRLCRFCADAFDPSGRNL